MRINQMHATNCCSNRFNHSISDTTWSATSNQDADRRFRNDKSACHPERTLMRIFYSCHQLNITHPQLDDAFSPLIA
jgi:hypothetical protein